MTMRILCEDCEAIKCNQKVWQVSEILEFRVQLVGVRKHAIQLLTSEMDYFLDFSELIMIRVKF